MTSSERVECLVAAVTAAHAALQALPIGSPLQQNGCVIDHTALNEAKRLCELAMAELSMGPVAMSRSGEPVGWGGHLPGLERNGN